MKLSRSAQELFAREVLEVFSLDTDPSTLLYCKQSNELFVLWIGIEGGIDGRSR
jgi:hypothetical protein